MSDICLSVPKGNHCSGCMFLDIDYTHNFAHCTLFNEKLSAMMDFGGVDESSITKLYKCPTEVTDED